MNLQETLETVRRNNIDISLIELVLAGSRVDTVDQRYGNTALHQAVQSQQALLVETLLKRGVGIDMPNKSEQTPLHDAVSRSSQAMVELLLRWGAKVNVHTIRLETPLLLAVAIENSRTSKQIIQLLLQYNAYSYSDIRASRMLRNYWTLGGIDQLLLVDSFERSFYTTLLLAGVAVPESLPFLEPIFQTVRCHLEATISVWLTPLKLCQSECARLTPIVLQVLPRFQEWLDLIARTKAQVFAGELFEATIRDEETVQQEKNEERKAFFEYFQCFEHLKPWAHVTQGIERQKAWARHLHFLRDLQENQVLIQALESRMPIELRDAVKEAFIHKTLIGLVKNRAERNYGLPPKVTACLVNDLRRHPENHAAFLRDRFRHDWSNTPWKPPGQSQASMTEAVTASRQFHRGRV